MIITVSGLKITPLASAVPEEADQLIRQAYALLPRVKITELLLEVDDWTGFTRHFTHLKNQEVSKDRILLLTAILADANQSGANQNGGSMPWSDLREADLAASMAHPRRDLLGCACGSGKCSI